MAKPIIAALRQRDDLRESLLHTVQELAHRASIYGVVRISLRYLARKCRCCKQTIITHLKKLIGLGILKKGMIMRRRDSACCEMNRYTFCLTWARTSTPVSPAQRGNGPVSRLKFPRQEEREKEGSLRGKLANQKKMLPLLYTPGSDQWNRTVEEIAHLEALLGVGGHATMKQEGP